MKDLLVSSITKELKLLLMESVFIGGKALEL